MVNRLLWLLNQLHYTPAEKKTTENDQWVHHGAISIQLNSNKKEEGKKKEREPPWIRSPTLLWYLLGTAFISVERGGYCKRCTIRQPNPFLVPQYPPHLPSPLMTDNVEMGARHDRHQFNGNCIVFSWGNFHLRSNIRKKWVCAAQRSTHYVDVVVDMKRNCAALCLACTTFQRRVRGAKLVVRSWHM